MKTFLSYTSVAQATVPAVGVSAANAEAAFLKAERLQSESRIAEAEQIYRRLHWAFPEHPAVLLRLAELAGLQGQLEEAEILIRRAVAAEPEEGILQATLGRILHSAGRQDAAEAAYRQALALEPGDADTHYNLGSLLEESDRNEEALQAYRGALSQRPDHVRALTRMAALLNRQGALDLALACADRAVAVDPQLFDAQYYRGWILSSLQRHDEALGALVVAARLKPDSFEAALAIANALRDAARYNDALSAYWRLIEVRPDRVASHVEFNQLAWMCGRADFFLRSFEYARQRLGEQPELLYLEAAFLLRCGRYAQAERQARRAHELAPERGDIAGLLARTLAGQGEFAESYPLFLFAIQVEPGVMLHRQEFGLALLRDRQASEARQVFEQALVLEPFDQLVLAGLTLAYRELGDSRYFQLFDVGNLVRVYDIAAPRGFSDVRTFNQALATELDALHTTKAEPIDQTLRGGTQTVGRLFDQQSRAITEVRAHIQEAVADYVSSLSARADHPVAARRSDHLAFSGSWSCRLESGGFHSNHVHPQGWISSAYYARLPGDLEDSQQGWLKFGESNLSLGENDRPAHFIRPVVGRLVLFPSFYWHGTVPFVNSGDRLTIAFDVVSDRTAVLPGSSATQGG